MFEVHAQIVTERPTLVEVLSKGGQLLNIQFPMRFCSPFLFSFYSLVSFCNSCFMLISQKTLFNANCSGS